MNGNDSCNLNLNDGDRAEPCTKIQVKTNTLASYINVRPFFSVLG